MLDANEMDAAAPRSKPEAVCCVCMDEQASHACVPCGHQCLCERCAETVQKRDERCPMCNGATFMTMRVYLP